MNIRNYTSNVSVESTVAKIEQRLAAAGAHGISKLYSPKGKIESLSFQIALGDRVWHVRVPANAEACFQAMWKEYQLSHRRPREQSRDRIMDQASRTAWKLVHDWVDVQISLIVMKQAEFLEVFMPYVWDGKRTFFQSVRENQFKALPERT
jgi:hypothetical protein